MHRLIIMSLLAILIAPAVNVGAQIRMNSGGHVKIGGTSVVNSTIKLNVHSSNYAGVSVTGSSCYGISATGSCYAGYFTGSVYSTGSYQGSDASLKTSLQDIVPAEAVQGIMSLRPTTFEYRREAPFAQMNLPEGRQYGLVAQELEVVFPEMVKETTQPPEIGEDGQPISAPISFKAINYTSLIPLLISVVQSQQKQIDELKDELQRNGLIQR